MSKDPAFLFYSGVFYEGTRTMLPEERACYVDLLIYQHQHGGLIPLDLKRVLMYCTGVTMETLNQVLNQKFNQTVDGWYNERLKNEMEKRSQYKPKKIASACLAGLISSNKNLPEPLKIKIKQLFKINDFIEYEESEIKEKIREWFNHLVNQMVNDYKNKDTNTNKDSIESNGKDSLKGKPFSEQVENCYLQCLEFFPDHLHPQQGKEHSWKDTIDKLNRIDGIPFEAITAITKKTREDKFWSKNFLSLTKLRKKNGDQIRYIVVFNENISSNEQQTTINRQTQHTIARNLEGW